MVASRTLGALVGPNPSLVLAEWVHRSLEAPGREGIEAREITSEILSVSQSLFEKVQAHHSTPEARTTAVEQLISLGLFSVTRSVDDGGVGGQVDDLMDVVRRVSQSDLSLGILVADHGATLLSLPAALASSPETLVSSWGGVVEAFGIPVQGWEPNGDPRLSGESTRHSLGLRFLRWDPHCQRRWRRTLSSGSPAQARFRDLALASAAWGCAEGLLAEAEGFARGRRQFNRPLAEFSVIGKMLLDMRVRLWRTEAFVRMATSAPEGLIAEICRGALTYASRTSQLCAGLALEIQGGNGLMEDMGVSRRFRDAQSVASLFAESSGSDGLDRAIDSWARRWARDWSAGRGVDASTINFLELWDSRTSLDRPVNWEVLR